MHCRWLSTPDLPLPAPLQTRRRLVRLLLCLLTLQLLCVASVSQAEPFQLIDTSHNLAADALASNSEAKLLSYLLQRYPSSYQVLELSRSRARLWSKAQPNACIPWLRKTTEREQEYWFSLPYLLESGIALISSPQRQLQLQALANPSGQISLAALLRHNPPLVLGAEQSRSYGEPIDQLLRQSPPRNLYLSSSTSGALGTMLPMLDKGFVDVLLEYPKIARRSKLPLQIWPLAEAVQYTPVHFACSRTAQGAQVVQALNQLIRQLSGDTAYQQLLLENLEPPDRAGALEYWQQLLHSAPAAAGKAAPLL